MARRRTLVERLSSVADPRVDRTKLHTLVDILAVSLCTMLCGADRFTEMKSFVRAKEAWLRTWLELPHGIPSHDTLGRVFARLDPESLRACFMDWVEALRDGLAETGLV